jgi:hypothetical protein
VAICLYIDRVHFSNLKFLVGGLTVNQTITNGGRPRLRDQDDGLDFFFYPCRSLETPFDLMKSFQVNDKGSYKDRQALKLWRTSTPQARFKDERQPHGIYGAFITQVQQYFPLVYEAAEISELRRARVDFKEHSLSDANLQSQASSSSSMFRLCFSLVPDRLPLLMPCLVQQGLE